MEEPGRGSWWKAKGFPGATRILASGQRVSNVPVAPPSVQGSENAQTKTSNSGQIWDLRVRTSIFNVMRQVGVGMGCFIHGCGQTNDTLQLGKRPSKTSPAATKSK